MLYDVLLSYFIYSWRKRIPFPNATLRMSFLGLTFAEYRDKKGRWKAKLGFRDAKGYVAFVAPIKRLTLSSCRL